MNFLQYVKEEDHVTGSSTATAGWEGKSYSAQCMGARMVAVAAVGRVRYQVTGGSSDSYSTKSICMKRTAASQLMEGVEASG